MSVVYMKHVTDNFAQSFILLGLWHLITTL